MLNYKRAGVCLLIYTVTMIFYFYFLPSKAVNISTPYNDIYIFTILLLLYYYLSYKYVPSVMEIYRFGSKKIYIFSSLKKFSIINLVIILLILIINLLLNFFTIGVLQIIDALYYSVNLYMIFEIIYLTIFLLKLLKKSDIFIYAFMIFILIMYIVGLYYSDNNIFIVNLFSSYFLRKSIWHIFFNYSIWILIPILYYNAFENKVEL